MPQPSQARGWAGLLTRKPPMLVRVALANKMARIVWALMARGAFYQAPAVRRKPVAVARTSERKRARSGMAQRS
jgi:hypothetical protein